MSTNDRFEGYRHWYSVMLRLYPTCFRERFCEEMEQTFADIGRERLGANEPLGRVVLWMFLETFLAIIIANAKEFVMQSKSINRIFVATGVILTVPLVAMFFSDEVVWNVEDFFIAGTLLIGSGLVYEFLASGSKSPKYRFGSIVAVGTTLLLVWCNLAVGIIGNEDNPANLLFFCVPAVEIAGALWARFRPQGMAMALLLTAVTQALIPIVAMLIWRPQLTWGVLLVLAFNSIFVVGFACSAMLFRSSGGSRHNLSAV